MHVAWLRALYSKLLTAVSDGNSLSAFAELINGIGQGDSNSTALHGAFLNDLPELLAKKGIGVDLFGTLIAILLFLDDICIPCTSPDQLKQALNIMHQYGLKWRITFNLSKGKSAVI